MDNNYERMMKMDAMVLKAQMWLNSTYGNDIRYTEIVEDGLTGWGTINALIIALQIELGMTETAAVIGPNTRNKFKEKYPNNIVEQEEDDTDTDNVYSIIQCALWCKGYAAEYGGITAYFKGQTAESIKTLKSDIGIGGNSTVDMDIMECLLSMKQFVLLSGGTYQLRAIQQSINLRYRDYTGIIPCDGLYGREMNTAIIQVLQAVEGFGPEVSNGNFGEGTKGALKVITSANASQYSDWVWIASVALVCNKYLSDATEDWTSAFQNKLEEFQSDYALPVTGQIDVNTWMSLFVSKGNPDRAAKACDTRFEITDALAQKIKADGYEIVGRYLTGGDFKEIRAGELERILSYGLKYFPIFQEVGTSESNYTYDKGKESAEKAVAAAIKHGVPNTVIYFAVDFDAMDYQVTNSIIPYFRGVSENIASGYQVGIYAPRNVCTRVCDAGYAVSSFVSDMSTGYSGNLGFPIPENWNYDQFHEIKGYGGSWDLDKVAYSGRVPACSSVKTYISEDYTPPEEPDMTTNVVGTIFDVIELIEELENAYADFKTRFFNFTTNDQYIPQNTAIGALNYLALRYLEGYDFAAAVQNPDTVFKQFMESEYPSLNSALAKYIASDVAVTDNIGGKNDPAHLALSTLAYTAFSLAPEYWASWGGDLATGIEDLHIAMEENPALNLQQKANALIGSDNCRCNYTDLCDDADCIAIAELIDGSENETHILSQSMLNYYNNVTTRRRYSQYEKDDGIDFTDMYNSVWTKYLNPGMGALDGEATFDEKKAGCRALSNYILWRLASSL